MKSSVAAKYEALNITEPSSIEGLGNTTISATVITDQQNTQNIVEGLCVDFSDLSFSVFSIAAV
jgi:hypothetical protein